MCLMNEIERAGNKLNEMKENFCQKKWRWINTSKLIVINFNKYYINAGYPELELKRPGFKQAEFFMFKPAFFGLLQPDPFWQLYLAFISLYNSKSLHGKPHKYCSLCYLPCNFIGNVFLFIISLAIYWGTSKPSHSISLPSP